MFLGSWPVDCHRGWRCFSLKRSLSSRNYNFNVTLTQKYNPSVRDLPVLHFYLNLPHAIEEHLVNQLWFGVIMDSIAHKIGS